MKIIEKSSLRLGIMLLALLCSFDTASAQNNTLSANPQQLTFNTQTGVTPTPQTLLVSSSSGTANVSVSAFSNHNWLVVSPTSGNTPLSLTVSVGAGAPTSGTDVGFINLSSAGSFLSIPVVLNANATTGPSPFTTSPTSLSFSLQANSLLPVSQPVTLSSSSSSVTTFTASPITSNGGSWLTVNPPSGSLSGSPLASQLQVTVNPAALTGAGPFHGVVAINSPGTTGLSLPVLVTIAGTPAIQVDPSPLSFAYQLGTTAPAAETLAITSSTGATVTFTATAKTTSCGNNWIVLSQQFGATPSTLNVEVNKSGLGAGTCSGEIDISAPGASNPNVVVPVSLLISSKPLLQVPSSVQPFTYQIGSTTFPVAQNVQITSSTSGVNFTATAAPVSGGPNFLEVSPNGTTPQSLMLSVNAAALNSIGPGTYSETVTVASAGAGNSPQTFPVTLVVNSNPILKANVQSLNFNHQIGQTVPSSQTVTLTSTGAPLNYQVAVNTASCPGFLSATPSTGSTFGQQNQVVVSVNTSGLTPKTCAGNITLSVPGSTTPPLVIPVTLNVSNTALLNVSQAAINLTVLPGALAATQTVSVTSTDATTTLPFTATAATTPVGLTWLAVTPNSGNTPNNLQVTINPANLPVGIYSGSITVSSTVANVPAQIIPVTLILASASVTATPASVTFAQAVGGTPPASQTVAIAGVPAGITIGAVATMLNGSGWLTTSATGNTITIAANGSQLQQGVFSGVVTAIVPGAANSPLNIPVTFNVGSALALSVSPGSVGFSYQGGSSTIPAAQALQVTTTAGSVPFTATFKPDATSGGGNFITVTPGSGTTPASISLAPNPWVIGTLAAGKYTGTVTVSSSSLAGGDQTVNVSLTVAAGSVPILTSVTSGASLQPGSISPGEIVTIFGTAIGPALPQQGIEFQIVNGEVPTTLGGVTVTFNNVLAPVLFVKGNQINCIVPYEIAGQPFASIVVNFAGLAAASFQARVVDTTPAIFSLTESGNGQGAILNRDLTVNGPNNPAAKGSFVSIYATGEGQLVPGVATGSITPGVLPLPKPIANVSVTIGGQTAQLSYQGEAPTLVSGVIQINAKIPANIASGNQPVVLTIGNNTNTQQSITVAVK